MVCLKDVKTIVYYERVFNEAVCSCVFFNEIYSSNRVEIELGIGSDQIFQMPSDQA